VKGDNQVDFSWANTQIDRHDRISMIGPAAGASRDVKVIS